MKDKALKHLKFLKGRYPDIDLQVFGYLEELLTKPQTTSEEVEELFNKIYRSTSTETANVLNEQLYDEIKSHIQSQVLDMNNISFPNGDELIKVAHMMNVTVKFLMEYKLNKPTTLMKEPVKPKKTIPTNRKSRGGS